MTTVDRDAASITRLIELMAHLRDPDAGCPWDVAQTFESIASYTIEEAYEVVDAIERGDISDLRDELGDLLLQVVFHARIAKEAGLFDFGDVADAIIAKLVRRHPHVFDADGRPLAKSAEAEEPARVEANWQRIKADERTARATSRGGRTGGGSRWLGEIPRNLPSLSFARKISREAARHGFDWTDTRDVLAKVREEIDEVEQSLAEDDKEAVVEEIGDLLFAVANLARHADVDPEDALRRGVRKFERRFDAMAARLAAEGRDLADTDLATMEAAWQTVKRSEP